MAKKFYSKGKGANRKVIPISDKKGAKQIETIGYVITFPVEKMSEPEREFETSKEYVYKKLDAAQDLMDFTRPYDTADFREYPGLEEVSKYLKDSHTIAKNAALNAKLLMEKHGGGVGPLVQSIHNSIHETIKLNYEAYMGIDKIIKNKEKDDYMNKEVKTYDHIGKGEDMRTVPAYSLHEGYSLPSIMADITDVEEDLYNADSILMRTFLDMRRAHYRERQKTLIDSPKSHGHGEMRVVGDISMVYNPDGSLRIKEFSRDILP